MEELKSRLVSCLFILLLTSATGYFLHRELIALLVKPLDSPLYYTSPTGGLNLVVTVSLYFGAALTIPFMIYQVYQFIKPALPAKAKINIISLILSSYILLLAGIFFAYFFSLPFALDILKSFGEGQIAYIISSESYLTFVTKYLVGFGLLFQLPLLLISVNAYTKLSLKDMLKYEKWVILGAFVLAAILTPTGDVINQLIMALPLIILYQLSILFILVINRKH